MKKNERVTKILRIMLIITFLIIPYSTIQILSIFQYEWLGRIIALISLYFFVMPLFAWYLFDTRTKVFSDWGKIHKVCKKKTVDIVEYIFRGLLLLVPIYIVIFMIPWFTLDLKTVYSKGEVEVIEGEVTDVSTPFLGLWFLRQGVEVGDSQRYQLVFSIKGIKVGEVYEFKILPESKEILEAKRITNN